MGIGLGAGGRCEWSGGWWLGDSRADYRGNGQGGGGRQGYGRTSYFTRCSGLVGGANRFGFCYLESHAQNPQLKVLPASKQFCTQDLITYICQ